MLDMEGPASLAQPGLVVSTARRHGDQRNMIRRQIGNCVHNQGSHHTGRKWTTYQFVPPAVTCSIVVKLDAPNESSSFSLHVHDRRTPAKQDILAPYRPLSITHRHRGLPSLRLEQHGLQNTAPTEPAHSLDVGSLITCTLPDSTTATEQMSPGTLTARLGVYLFMRQTLNSKEHSPIRQA